MKENFQSDAAEMVRLNEEKSIAQRFRTAIGRSAAAGLMIATGGIAALTYEAFTPAPAVAYDSSTGDYPDWNAPCYPASIVRRADGTTYCSNYDWRVPKKDVNGDITSWPEWTGRGYGARNCTDYVAWRVKEEYNISISGLGNATKWDTNAAAKGYSVDSTPEIGDIAQWEGNDSDEYNYPGHVAFVVEKGTGTRSGQVRVSEYNQQQSGNFRSDRWVTASHYIDVNSTNAADFKLKIGEDSTLPPNPDTDGDGILNVNDKCPTTYAKTPSGCPKADFNQDGRADLTAFYRMDPNQPVKWTWQGKADGTTTANGWLWQGPAGWEASRIIQAGVGDFNGDKKEDVATFYRHDNGYMDINVWYGDGMGNATRETPWSSSAGWDANRILPAGVGDFNNDGKDDIAAWYRYDNNVVALDVWWGNTVAGGQQVMTGQTQAWMGNGWDGYRVVGGGVTDQNGDGKSDIVSYYRHDNGAMDVNVWAGNGSGGFTLTRPWSAVPGSGWDVDRLIPAGAGDIDRNGYGDALAFYRYDNGGVNLWLWKGKTDGTYDNPIVLWSVPVGSGWDANRILPAGVSDYNGDGKLDVATFYNYDGGQLQTNIWYQQSGNAYAPTAAFRYLSGWEGSRLNPVK